MIMGFCLGIKQLKKSLELSLSVKQLFNWDSDPRLPLKNDKD